MCVNPGPNCKDRNSLDTVRCERPARPLTCLCCTWAHCHTLGHNSPPEQPRRYTSLFAPPSAQQYRAPRRAGTPEIRTFHMSLSCRGASPRPPYVVCRKRATATHHAANIKRHRRRERSAAVLLLRCPASPQPLGHPPKLRRGDPQHARSQIPLRRECCEPLNLPTDRCVTGKSCKSTTPRAAGPRTFVRGVDATDAVITQTPS